MGVPRSSRSSLTKLSKNSPLLGLIQTSSRRSSSLTREALQARTRPYHPLLSQPSTTIPPTTSLVLCMRCQVSRPRGRLTSDCIDVPSLPGLAPQDHAPVPLIRLRLQHHEALQIPGPSRRRFSDYSSKASITTDQSGDGDGDGDVDEATPKLDLHATNKSDSSLGVSSSLAPDSPRASCDAVAAEEIPRPRLVPLTFSLQPVPDFFM